jgi:hypothetical protein
VTFKENGNVSAESLKAMLVKGRMNYVVMETGDTWMIKTTVEAMLSSCGISIAVSDFRAK